MASDLQHGFRLGSWKIEPLRGAISGPNGEAHHVEPKVMDVLVHLAERAGELVTRDQLLEAVWRGQVAADELLTRAISELRRALHDDPSRPHYIETVPKRGYRLIGKIHRPGREGLDEDRAPAFSITWFREHRLAVTLVTLAVVVVAAWSLAFVFFTDRFDPPEHSIAVLPFSNFSNDPEQEYFVNGMHDALISELAGISGLDVRAKRSTLRYKETTLPVEEIARELDVAMIVEASVLKEENQVRIQIQLISARPERHLLTQTYDRELSNVLEMQSAVTRDIAEKIRVNLTPQERHRLMDIRAVDPETYTLWLKGNFHVAKITMSEEPYWKALAFYQQAIDRDPDFAPAHAGLARAYMMLGTWHASQAPRDVIRLSKNAAEQALALDPEEATAYFVLGSIRRFFEWDWDGAERAFREGMRLNPNEMLGRLWYANFLTSMGRFDESIEVGRRTLEIDPWSSTAYAELGFALWFAGRDGEALEFYRRGLEIDPEDRQIHFVLSGFHVKRGEFDQALEQLAWLERYRQDWNAIDIGILGRTYALAGRESEARAMLSELLDRRTREAFVPASALAHLYVGLGEHDEALRWFEVAYEERAISLVWLKEMWVFDRLRSDPRFQAILERMDFPET